MDKELFKEKFNDAYKTALDEIKDSNYYEKVLREYSDENFKLDLESAVVFAVNASLDTNKKIMYSVLENLLVDGN